MTEQVICFVPQMFGNCPPVTELRNSAIPQTHMYIMLAVKEDVLCYCCNPSVYIGSQERRPYIANGDRARIQGRLRSAVQSDLFHRLA